MSKQTNQRKSATTNFFHSFRTIISGDKERYCRDGFDVDLTYITDRLIAMSFPAEGVEATYRNDINEVSELLHRNHEQKYLVFNLSLRNYDERKFGGKVISEFGWPDHHNPPLLILFKAIDCMHKFLTESAENVVAVHCLAGKGRTGVLLACYMLYAGLFDNNICARCFFANKRSLNNWGVASPAQIRYIEYFEYILHNGAPKNIPLRLLSITLHGIPNFARSGGCTPFIEIFDWNVIEQNNHQKLVWDNSHCLRVLPLSAETHSFHVSEVVQGDLYFLIRHINSKGSNYEKMGWFAIHTGMIAHNIMEKFQVMTNEVCSVESEGQSDSYEIFCRNIMSTPPFLNIEIELNSRKMKGEHLFRTKIPKSQIDCAYLDRRFPQDFYLELTFSTVPAEIKPKITVDESQQFTVSYWNTIKPVDEGRDGSIRFIADDKLSERVKEAKNFSQLTKFGSLERGGWLFKQGHNVRNWKRRWFVLHPDVLEYYKKPNSLTSSGKILIRDITAVEEVDEEDAENSFYDLSRFTSDGSIQEINIGRKTQSVSRQDRMKNMFVIHAQDRNYYCSCDNEQEREDWMELINTAVQLQEEKESEKRHTLGRLSIRVCSARIFPKFRLTSVSPYAIIKIGEKCYRTKTQQNTLKPIFNDIPFDLSYSIPVSENLNTKPMLDCIVQIWGEGALQMTSDLIGEVIIPSTEIIRSDNKIQTYEIKNGSDYTGNISLVINFIPTDRLDILYKRISDSSTFSEPSFSSIELSQLDLEIPKTVPVPRKSPELHTKSISTDSDPLVLEGFTIVVSDPPEDLSSTKKPTTTATSSNEKSLHSDKKTSSRPLSSEISPRYHRKTTIIENYIENINNMENSRPHHKDFKRVSSSIVSPTTNPSSGQATHIRRTSSAGKMGGRSSVFAYYDVTGTPLGITIGEGGWRTSELYKGGERTAHLGSSRIIIDPDEFISEQSIMGLDPVESIQTNLQPPQNTNPI